MKWIKLVAAVLGISLIFTGCSFRLASSVDELISPVAPEGDNAGVQSALENFCKGGFSLKTPVGGEYTTSYIFYDIDADGEQEAVAFYEPSSELGTVNMALIDKVDGSWSAVSNIVGDGTGVYSVDFSDMNGDNVPEIIVLWDVIKNSSSHSLCVYGYEAGDKEKTLVSVGDKIKTNAYTVVDIDGDGVNEIMMFTVQAGDSNNANAALYSYKNGTVRQISKTKLDGHITSYESIVSEKAGDMVYVYADAVNSNGIQMNTEVIHWSNYYDSIISPFYSYQTATTKDTARSAMLTSRDVNGDGRIEIPLDAEAEGLPEEIEAVNWKQYDNYVLTHACYSIAVQKDNYQLVIPDSFMDNIIVEYDYSKSLLTISDKSENVMFSVVSLLKSQYDEGSNDYSQYTEIMKSSGCVYLAKAENTSEMKVTVDDLKAMITSYKGE